MAARSAILNVMIGAVEKAGRALIRDFGEVEQLQISRKGPGDFVSAADLKSEKILMEELKKARPAYGFHAEESGITKGEDAEFTWIIDPLDGTRNFLHGLPHWCVTVALQKKDEIVAGVIHDPVKNEIFYGEKGGGAFSGTKRLRVSGRETLDEALLALDTNALTAETIPLGWRFMGSTCLNLAYVAAGRFDGCIAIGYKTWDSAAGSLLIREAGGFVSDFSGGKNYIDGSHGLVAANQKLHAALLQKTKTEKAKAASGG